MIAYMEGQGMTAFTAMPAVIAFTAIRGMILCTAVLANDYVYGDAGDDQIYGGLGVDILFGGNGDDSFYFASGDTGNKFSNRSDFILNFDDGDEIHIPTGLNFAGQTSDPNQGEYSVWEDNGYHIVTWRDTSGFHDIQVLGEDPSGSIFSDVSVA